MSQPAMDANAFAEMKELMGTAFLEIISMCLQTLPEQLLQVETAIQSQDAEALFNTTHKMKSSCGSIGAFGLAEKIEVVELISRDGSTEIPEHAYNDMLSDAQRVIATLTAELNKGSA